MEASAARTPDLLSPSASPTATRHDTTYMSRFSHGETRSSTSPKHHHHHHHHHHHQPCGNCAVSSGCNTSCTVPSRRSRTCHLSTFSGNLSCCIPAHRQVPLLTLGQASPSAAPNDHHDATDIAVPSIRLLWRSTKKRSIFSSILSSARKSPSLFLHHSFSSACALLSRPFMRAENSPSSLSFCAVVPLQGRWSPWTRRSE
ncbi:hypothetical protein IWX50DRAFT_11864 [Phyllosticta citricarpa]